MSVYSSICRDHDDDPFDVAYSYVDGHIRLVSQANDPEGWTLISQDQALHLIELIQSAILRANK